MKLCLHLLLLLLLAVANGLDENTRLHWVCFHYHKTGSEFCTNIAVRIASACKVKAAFDDEWRQDKLKNASNYYHNSAAKALQSSDLYSTRPLALLGDWKQIFNFPRHAYRIIHMVRDPFEIIMSAYKYHAQVPPPELWIHEKPATVCGVGRKILLTDALGAYFGDIPAVEDWVRGIAATCDKSMDMFSVADATYQQVLAQTANLRSNPDQMANPAAAKAYLQTVFPYEHDEAAHGPDVYLAIRMEAFRSLPAIIYMTITKLNEVPGMALSMHLEEFGIGNRTLFRSGATKMMQFFLQGIEAKNRNDKCPLCNCLDLSKAVDLVEDASFVPIRAAAAPQAGSKRKRTNTGRGLVHVTTHLMASATKAMYIQRLGQDPVLSPLLRLIAQIIRTPTPQSGSRLMDRGLPKEFREAILTGNKNA